MLWTESELGHYPRLAGMHGWAGDLLVGDHLETVLGRGGGGGGECR